MSIPFNSALFDLRPDLQQTFWNRNTGTLLSAGVIYFYEDTARTVAKDVYYIDGDNPSMTGYTLSPFPNPLTLSSIGTVVDPNGAAKLIYWDPFDNNGNGQNYYIEIYSAGGKATGVLQETIVNFPGVSTNSSASVQATTNYIPNGQFLLHNLIPPTNLQPAGYITMGDTQIAPGCHHFVTDSTSDTVNNFVTFFQDLNDIPSTSVFQFPRYWAEFNQEGTNFNGTRSDYTARFKNVNTFVSSIDDPVAYTFSFAAYSVGDPFTAQVFYNKFFGQGGSASVSGILQTITIGSSPGTFTIIISNIPDNESDTIGTGGDDYIEIGIRFPVLSAYHVRATNILTMQGSNANLTYPTTTNFDDSSSALAGGVPFDTYDGSFIGLPVVFGPAGFTPDISAVGQPGFFGYLPTWDNIPYLFADGTSYQINNLSTLQIPYSRLAGLLWNSTVNSYLYGTGYEFFTSSIPNQDNNILLYNNSFGSVSPTSPGTSGFTVSPVSTASVTSYYVKSYLGGSPFIFSCGITSVSLVATVTTMTANNYSVGQTITVSGCVETEYNIQAVVASIISSTQFTYALVSPTTSPATGTPVVTGSSLFYVETVNPGICADPTVGTSTFTISVINSTVGGAAGDSVTARGLFSVTTVAAAGLVQPSAPGLYFTFDSYNGVDTPYYVWFFFSSETDPAPGGTGIKITLISTDSASVVAQKIQAALLGGQVSVVGCTSGSAITNGEYFSATSSNSETYNFYYIVDGAPPMIPTVSGVNVPVNILSTDTNLMVASETQVAINQFMVGVPDWRGLSFRAWDSGRGLDPDSSNRYSFVPGYGGDNVGTFQPDQFAKHAHPMSMGGGGYQGFASGDGDIDYAGLELNTTGGNESRSYNAYVAVGIRY